MTARPCVARTSKRQQGLLFDPLCACGIIGPVWRSMEKRERPWAMLATVGAFLVATVWLAGCGESNDGGNGPSGSPPGPSTHVVLGQEREGIATYYGATGEGACMFDRSPGDLDVAALNLEDWDGSALCGACAEVTGPSGSVRIRIVDLCPECRSGHLDLSQEAFAKIATPELGRVDIHWQLVACDVSGPVAYRFKDGANPWWTAVQVRNHRVPVRSMEFSKDGASWAPMDRMDYNYFLAADGFGDGSTWVRLEAFDGQTLEDELPAVQEYLQVDGHAQFE